MYKVTMNEIYNVGSRLGLPSVDEDGNLYNLEEMERLVSSRFRLYEVLVDEISKVQVRQEEAASKYKRLEKTMWRVGRERQYDGVRLYINRNFKDLVLDHGFSRVKKFVIVLGQAALAISETEFEKLDGIVEDYCILMKINV